MGGVMENDSTKVNVTLGYTLNLGNFQSLRLDLGVIDSKRDGETTEQAFERVYKFVEEKLTDKIKEAQGKPKAIFLAGPAGSGKTFTSAQLIPKTLTVINVDDTYEELLKAAGLGMKIADFDQDQLSQAAKLMGQAQKATKEKYAQLSAAKQNIVIDGTGAASKPLLKKKQELALIPFATKKSSLILPAYFLSVE